MIPAGSFFESAPDRGHAVRQSGTVSPEPALVCRRIALPADYKSNERAVSRQVLPILPSEPLVGDSDFAALGLGPLSSSGGQRHETAACCAIGRIAPSEATCLNVSHPGRGGAEYTAGIVRGRRWFDSSTADQSTGQMQARAVGQRLCSPSL